MKKASWAANICRLQACEAAVKRRLGHDVFLDVFAAVVSLVTNPRMRRPATLWVCCEELRPHLKGPVAPISCDAM